MPQIEEVEHLIANEKPIDEADPAYADLLKDLQCNILTGHGKSRRTTSSFDFRTMTPQPD